MQSSTQPGSLGTKFQDHGAAPSEALWGNIEAALEEKERKRRGILWWWIGAGASAAVILTLVLVNLNPTSNKEMIEVLPVEENTEEQSSEESPAVDDHLIQTENIQPIENELDLPTIETTENKSDEALENKQYKITDEKIIINGVVINESSNRVSHTLEDGQYSFVEDKPLQLLDYPEISRLELSNRPALPDLACIPINTKQQRPWEVGFNVSYWYDASRFGAQKTMETNNDQLIANNPPPQTGTFALEEAINGNNNPLGEGTVSRNINISAFAGKYINQRWSWRVGLDFTRTTFKSEYYSSMTLSYPDAQGTTAISSIGIPVSLQFNIIQKPMYKFRASLSMINEIPVFERTETSYTSKQFITGYMGAWQIGLSNDIRIGRNLYLSIAPAYRYYSMQTIKSELPLAKKRHWIGGSIGLTWEL